MVAAGPCTQKAHKGRIVPLVKRAAPEYSADRSEAWLQGFDGVPIGTEAKPVSDRLETEVDEGALAKGDN
ncbi:hypothetical protein LB553_20840 [Mesorhizobium sp. CA8]|uniref:hypothetical protein n=1 Tax=Mesorhizobium sp. CA8 TaxID=2876637 RepID=UPI001CC9BDE3|nr:hypothetical protein [Mesorhizobium sp. CA8]MBZ9763311.1 hypothetical protein [Mesorhizobium sp. CA8]